MCEMVEYLFLEKARNAQTKLFIDDDDYDAYEESCELAHDSTLSSLDDVIMHVDHSPPNHDVGDSFASLQDDEIFCNIYSSCFYDYFSCQSMVDNVIYDCELEIIGFEVDHELYVSSESLKIEEIKKIGFCVLENVIVDISLTLWRESLIEKIEDFELETNSEKERRERNEVEGFPFNGGAINLSMFKTFENLIFEDLGDVSMIENSFFEYMENELSEDEGFVALSDDIGLEESVSFFDYSFEKPFLTPSYITMIDAS
ncbi:hypothetical protein vseg_007300 [Gypsophila vaccaria]